jgi:3-oxoacyl-[acyl-carrier-protein] synthase II
VEAIACIKALETGHIPPTIGLYERDPECDLDYVANVKRVQDLQYVMSNSFALGGFNASLIIGRPRKQ